ncbi:MAG TPA: TIGR03435 family protein [Acidobacteriaceae bacterium]|nr:TIGR03435 family protein [Acidobacteriaceae bacterium]
MKKMLLCVMASVLMFAGGLRAQDIAGNWQGTLAAGKGLRMVIKITKDDGKLKGVMYSIDQSPQPIGLSTVAVDGKTVTFGVKPFDLMYTGTLNEAGTAIVGTATQGGQSHALNLDKVSEENTWPIPEAPKPMAADAKPKFEVVTVKPSEPGKPGKLFTVQGRHVLALNMNVSDLLTFGYGLNMKQIEGSPAWFSEQKFDVDGIPDVPGQPNLAQIKLLMQDVLASRFQVKFHHEQKELAVYELTVGKGGPTLTDSVAKPTDSGGFGYRRLGELRVTNQTMKEFAEGMQGSAMDRPVIDHTGLTGRYDFTLNWTPDDSQFLQFGPRPPQPETADPNAPPGLYTAIQEQLGLKLQPAKLPADVMVIDHAEKPSAN